MLSLTINVYLALFVLQQMPHNPTSLQNVTTQVLLVGVGQAVAVAPQQRRRQQQLADVPTVQQAGALAARRAVAASKSRL